MQTFTWNMARVGRVGIPILLACLYFRLLDMVMAGIL